MKLTDGYAAAGNTDADKSRVDERYRLIYSYPRLLFRMTGHALVQGQALARATATDASYDRIHWGARR